MRKAKPPVTAPVKTLVPDQLLCFAIYSTMTGLNKVYRPSLKELRLTYPQYLVMLVLWDADQRTVSQIGESLFLDSPTLTPLLKRLEAAGLLTRRRSKSDERQVIVALTPAGRKLQARAVEIPGCIAAAMECPMPEIEALNKKLIDMRNALMRNAA